MRVHSLLPVFLLVVIGAGLVAPARAITYDPPAVYGITCTGITQSNPSAYAVWDRNTTGTGREILRFLITDGAGTVLYSRDFTRAVGYGQYPPGFAYTTAPAYNPIRFLVTSPAGNGFPEQVLYDITGECPGLPLYEQPGNPAIDIEKATDGADADTPPGPTITVGDPVAWTYVVTNTGDVALSAVSVMDDQGVTVTCPKTTLAVGESMTCTGNGTAVSGQYANLGTAVGTYNTQQVSDSDPSHYFGQEPVQPSVSVTKTADPASLPEPGGPVTFTISITNTSADGALTLQSLADSVYGDLNGVGTCVVPQTIDVNTSYTCEFTVEITGAAGYRETNTVTASGVHVNQLVFSGSSTLVTVKIVRGPAEPTPSPGCDVLLPIPATAVGGTFVADAPLYWAPGKLTSPLVTIAAGNSARVLGLDATGQYYKIIWVCDFLWVPKATLGPNYDAVWNGAPLPTGVVE